MLTIVAMVMTTVMPAASHASMNPEPTKQTAPNEMVSSHDHADCDHHADKASHDKHAAQNKPCCEKGACKCIGGNCHGGLTSILGKDSNAIAAFSTRPAQFTFADQYIESAKFARLKRPPKA